MFSLEPGRTPYDLQFGLFGIPVRIHPGFWLVAFILGYQPGQKPVGLLIWVGAIFFSILVHELGHALLMQRFGYAPRIALYYMGGLAIPDEGYSTGFARRRRDTWTSILISLAGPGAGFLLAAWTVLLLVVAGGKFWLLLPTMETLAGFWHVVFPENTPEGVRMLVLDLLYINIFWGLVNLIPVLPLDGGQVARDLLVHRDRHQGLIHALQLSIAVGAVTAIGLWVGLGNERAAIMFALLAASNYLTLQQLGRNW